MCKHDTIISEKSIDGLVADYFKADDYGNDNLPDVLYWCVKGLVLLHLIKRPITKGYSVQNKAESIAYHEALRLFLDAVFLRLRLFTSVSERYSGGMLLKELKDFANLKTALEDTYGKFIKSENRRTIQKFCKYIPATYNRVYGYKRGATCPEFVRDYEREKFHQDNHSGGAKYEILGYINRGLKEKTVRRADKPTINFLKIYCCLEELSSTILNFCEICNFHYGNILRNCNRYHDDLDVIIHQSVSIYNYDFTEEFLIEIKDLINKRLPKTLWLISRDVCLE